MTLDRDKCLELTLVALLESQVSLELSCPATTANTETSVLSRAQAMGTFSVCHFLVVTESPAAGLRIGKRVLKQLEVLRGDQSVLGLGMPITKSL